MFQNWGRAVFLLCLGVGFSLFIVPAQSQEDESAESIDPGWKSVQMPFNYQNIQVPRELWQSIKEILRKDGVKESVLEDFAVLPVAAQVELMDPNHSVLKDSLNHRLLFIEGGGTLDLFDFVVGKGDFYVRFSPELNEGATYHLVYISDSPGQDVGRKKWGNGCGRIYDLTQSADKFFFDYGMKVNSNKRHYLHLMAGTFIFFQLVDDRLYLSYIRLTDSRYPKFNCHST